MINRTILSIFAVLFICAALSAESDNPVDTEQNLEISVSSVDLNTIINSLQFNQFYTTKEIRLPVKVYSNQELRVDIRKTGGGVLHIDSVLIPGFRLIENELLVEKLTKTDHDVIDATKGMSLFFERTEDPLTEPLIIINGRLEPVQISKRAFRFPEANTYRDSPLRWLTYNYEMDSNPGTMLTDGELRIENLGEPFFNEYIPVASGHPQGNTMGWIKNDGTNLYVALDFTADNTIDGEKDYAAVYLGRGRDTKEYRISAHQDLWGETGFTYTDEVSYQHKVYEFAIPLNEIPKTITDTGTIPISFETYGTAAALGQLHADLAYNFLLNEYLLVYQQIFTVDSLDVEAKILSGDGTVEIVSAFTIESGVDSEPSSLDHDIDLAACFDPEMNQYLVVWAHDPGDPDTPDIYGQLIDAEGNPTGELLEICSEAGKQTEPAIAYDDVNRRFMVIWSDDRSEGDYYIYGRTVEGDGSMGTEFEVSNGTGGCGAPDLAFDPVNTKFLAVFYNNPETNFEIFGQFLDLSGSTVGTDSDTNFKILGRTDRNMLAPALVYNPDTEIYLMAVGDSETDSVVVRLIDSNGNLFDHDDDGIVEEVDDFIFLNEEGEMVEADFNPATGLYQVVWQHDYGAADDYEQIEGQQLDSDGELVGDTQDLAHNTISGYGDKAPQVAANPYTGNFLMAYHENYDNSETNNLAIFEIGTNSPNPGLVWTGTDPGGVTPTAGSSGDEFTFEIEYFSADDTPPETAEVWIDLNGDGNYSDMGFMSPYPSPGWMFPPPDAVSVLLMLGILILFPGLILIPKTRWYGATAFLLIMLTGCSFYDGKGIVSGSLELSPEFEERFAMEEADPEDSDYTDGKIYTLTMQIVSTESIVNYKFVFTDGVNQAYGYGASERFIELIE